MELNKIVKMQQKLDAAIIKAHNVTLKKTSDKKFLALLVELSEFANEIQSFKYWKKNKVINKDNVHEEFVDGLHFFISLRSDYKIEETNFQIDVLNSNLDISFMELYTNLCLFWKNKADKKIFVKAFEIFLSISVQIGMTYEIIEKVYIIKNKKNYERIANNY